MIKPKPENWLKVCLILIPILLFTLFVVASDRSREEVRNIELENRSKERLEEIESEMKNMYKQIRKLESSKPSKKTVAKAVPKPAPKPAVAQSSYPKTSHIPAMVRNAFGSEYAVKVAACESGFSPDIVYGPRVGLAGERGVMQIHPTHLSSGALARYGFTWADMWIPEKNIAFAVVLYNQSGWSPWTCA